MEGLTFQTREALEEWLARHHSTEKELWVRIFKKQSGTMSVDWNDCVLAVLAWGWIDGKKQSLDEFSYLQRLTPRRPRSTWSSRNCAHVQSLIAEGRMQPSGMAEVEAARADGRFEQAYAGSRDMVLPPEFLAALSEAPGAQAAFDKLSRAEIFKIYYKLKSAKKQETRARRIAEIVVQLQRGPSAS